jgi:four helix bundle protein
MHWNKLTVWQKAHELTLKIYKTSCSFPKDEKYNLTSQLRRSCSSIPANIVEGQSRNTTKDYINFLYNARASLEETRYHLLLTKDLTYITDDQYRNFENDCAEISKMLNALIKQLKIKGL